MPSFENRPFIILSIFIFFSLWVVVAVSIFNDAPASTMFNETASYNQSSEDIENQGLWELIVFIFFPEIAIDAGAWNWIIILLFNSIKVLGVYILWVMIRGN